MFDNDRKGSTDLLKLNRWRRYQSTLSFILYAATKRLYPASKLRIDHSMSQGFYCHLGRRISKPGIRKIQKMMRRIIAEDIPIRHLSLSRTRAIRLFKEQGRRDILALLENTLLTRVKVYSLLDLYDMYTMPPFESTGQAPLFYLENFPPGFIIIFPIWQNLFELPEYIPQPRLAGIFKEYGEWAQILGIRDVGELNRAIKAGRGPEIVKVSEALHEKKIGYIADRITKERRRIILIAGPSSAGKTTFTKRLAVQLLVNGLKPLMISIDDYFLPHSKTPRDRFGRLDFESIHAVDIPLLNNHLTRIVEGKTITTPKFNFLTGRRNIGKAINLPKDGVILLEGIHCLNEELTRKIPRRLKFKIYISALTQLNIDDHNRISTTDTRMLRRIVRDTRFRGYRIQGILNHWGSVRMGEERNIYPFQEEADEMFNSALIYETAVLKKFCVPIVRRIKIRKPEFEEVRRLLDFFNLFYDLDGHVVPSNSILREFISGSSFVY
jgi:uridine kinase